VFPFFDLKSDEIKLLEPIPSSDPAQIQKHIVKLQDLRMTVIKRMQREEDFREIFRGQVDLTKVNLSLKRANLKLRVATATSNLGV